MNPKRIIDGEGDSTHEEEEEEPTKREGRSERERKSGGEKHEWETRSKKKMFQESPDDVKWCWVDG